MSKITSDETVLNFEEGIIGFPAMRQAMLVRLPDYEPFWWLASLNDPHTKFLVVNPREIYPDYEPVLPAEIAARLDLHSEDKPLIFSTVKISSDWTKTTINLRAPLFVNAATKRGAQAILSGTDFRHDERLPQTVLEEEKGGA
jgi:flagellar assembly factor FliW